VLTPGGELFDYILANRYLKEKDASRLFAQLISGVDYLHQKHIVHRDLKLENLLLDRHRNIIITDFGFANAFEREGDDLMATSCGSPCYAAPELVVSEGLYVGTAVDVWSCGVILYAMLSGYLPYDDDPDNPDGDNINLLYKYIMSTPLNFPDHMSRMAMDLLLMMLVPNPQERCNIPQIEVHPWLAAHQSIFERSVEEHELVFTENMQRKSQAAKRDLAHRRRLQQEAKLVKAFQRSHSTAPGSSGMLDDHRRSRDQRHRSALPATSTVPDYLYNAGHRDRFPALDPRQEQHYRDHPAPSAVPSLALPPLPLHEPVSEPQSSIGPTTPPQTPPRPRTTSAHCLNTPEREIVEPVTPPRRGSAEPRTPMSANKNRHTIQVEYDGDKGWERFKNLQPTTTKPSDIVEAPPAKPLNVPQIGDMEVESTSEVDSKMESRTNTPLSLAPAPLIAPSISKEPENVEVPEQPVVTDKAEPKLAQPEEKPAEEKASAPAEAPTSEDIAPPPRPPRRSPSIPQTPSKRPREGEVDDLPSATTPKITTTSESQVPTPRAETRSRTVSTPLPPGAATPKAQPSSAFPESSVPARPPKRDRATRRGMGMSLDKFGLAKLLGQAQAPAASRPSYIPVSQHNKSHSVAITSSAMAPPAPPSSADKKARRKTVQLMNPGSRTSTPDNMSSRASHTSSFSNKDVVIGPQGIQPRPSHDRQSSTSIVTVDAFGDSHVQRTASSSAAKRVMDWFRRKSLAKDTLSTIKSGSVRADSISSSAGRPSVSADRSYVHITAPANANEQPKSIVRDESVSPLTDGPSIVISDSPPKQKSPERKETIRRKQPEVREPAAPSPSEKRVPLAPANSKANVDKTLLSPERGALPMRSKSVRTPNAPSAAAALINPHHVADATQQANGTLSAEDSKMRVHSGLVDQSVLTSRPPKEVMAEVIRVLHGMGMDVKQEADYRLRCTRVRRRKAGPTTGLSTGAAGLGPIALVQSSSKSSDGRPLPSTGSGGLSGLKGMLLRRGSSYSSYSSHALARSESDLLASASTSTTPQLASPHLGPAPEPVYGEHAIDNGDEVKFVVELCRIKNLQGLYLLRIKRLRGSVWAFKFIYQTIVDRCETLTH
jgi:protein-serine/threonine kinase